MIKKTVQFNRSQRLFIELGTTLLLEPKDPERAVSSQLIGMDVGKYLIVQMADQNLQKDHLTAGEPLKVKYILSDDVFAFNSHIIRTIQDPDSLIFLEYPKDVESCNIRAKKRVECFLPIQIRMGENRLKAVIVNINKNGCLCMVDKSIPLECCKTKPVTLQLSYGQFESLSIKGEIRSSRVEGRQTRFGILFDDLGNFSKKVLATLVPALKL
jgi:c-di-GMP-binding flagellar brake protein YcgR